MARTVPPSLISTFGRLGASATSPVRSTTTPATTTATAARAASHRQRRTPLTGPALDGGRPRPPRHGRPRPATPSLARIRETWTLAVLGVMNSSGRSGGWSAQRRPAPGPRPPEVEVGANDPLGIADLLSDPKRLFEVPDVEGAGSQDVEGVALLGPPRPCGRPPTPPRRDPRRHATARPASMTGRTPPGRGPARPAGSAPPPRRRPGSPARRRSPSARPPTA